MRILLFVLAMTITTLSLNSQSFHGTYEPDHATSCLHDSERMAIRNQNAANIASLKTTTKNKSKVFVSLNWPLEQDANFDDPSYYLITNFVDHDNGLGILDYEGNARTYDGHMGTDIAIWPFTWYKQNVGQVNVIAAAAGTIINKQDGSFDENCVFPNNNGAWNAIYVQHLDGSVAWYGHLKKYSLTEKEVGDNVVAGEYLGKVGSSGFSTAPHLHFELYADSAQTQLLDPFAGPSNSLNGTTSWWSNQKPYIDDAVLRLSTFDCIPNQPDGCPANTYDMCESDRFDRGSTIRYGMHFRMQRNINAFLEVRDPSGNIQFSQTHTPNNTFTYGSWWYWNSTIPDDAEFGTWTFNLSYDGEVFTKEFEVGATNSGNVAIGSAKAGAKLDVSGGDVYVNSLGSGVIIRSHNGKCWRLVVGDNGVVTSESVQCPNRN